MGIPFAPSIAALSVVESDQASDSMLDFCFPAVYRAFLQFLPGDIGEQVSTTKSRVLKFLGNKFHNSAAVIDL